MLPTPFNLQLKKTAPQIRKYLIDLGLDVSKESDKQVLQFAVKTVLGSMQSPPPKGSDTEAFIQWLREESEKTDE